MPRRAFIGLSSPLAYDYKPDLPRIDPRDGSAPNPVLEDAMGLLLFYDEIVFLSRHLCPVNMRSLEYVSFLTDREDFNERFRMVQSAAAEQNELHPFGYEQFRSMLDSFGQVISTITGQPRTPISRDEAKFITDNHTHSIWLTDEISVRASCTDFRLMCVDWEVISQFELGDCDPIYNSANAQYYGQIVRCDADQHSPTTLAQQLVVRHLPNYLGPLGPYHESIEELRQHQFVEDLRTYLDDLVASGDLSEVSKVASEMERIATEYRDRIFREHLSGRNEYFTIGKAIITEVAGLAIPGIGLATELVESCLRKRERDSMRWAGFVAEIPAVVGGRR